MSTRYFEAILLVIYENLLCSDPLQFGFKNNTSCSHASFGFTEAVNYCRKRGDKVFCATVDASKAFDKVLLNYKNKNWIQFLFIVKAAVLKQQISKFYPQIQRTEDSDHIYFSQRPFINVKAIFCA